MRRWLISAPILALALALMGQPSAVGQAIGPGETGEITRDGYRVRDFSPNKPTVPQVYDSAIPRIYVRFDDGLRVQYTRGQIQAFLRRGIPVTMCLNADGIDAGDAGNVTWAMVRDLQSFARSHGTVLHIAQHTNDNFNGDGESSVPSTMTHAEIVASLNVESIYRETGYRPRVLVMPGNVGVIPFYRNSTDYLISVADSLGLWWIDHNQDSPDSMSYVNMSPSVMNMDTYSTATSSSYGTPYPYQRPSMGIQRWELVSRTLDLGNHVIERVASDLTGSFEPTATTDFGARNLRYGYEFETGVKPPDANGWTFTGYGAAASGSGLFTKTWAYYYSAALSGNYGFAVVLHDSANTASTPANPFTGITEAEYVAGAISPDHMAWTIAMLRDKGHLVPVGIEEYAQWVTGEYAPNTDLIDNPRCVIPQFDIGDTLGATSEYAMIRGFGSHGVNNATPSASAHQIANLTLENTGNVAKYARRTSSANADNPYYAIGDSVTGTRGRSGGILMRADPSAGPERMYVVMGNLKPGGKYRFSIDIKTSSGGNPAAEEFHLAYKVKTYKLNDSVEAGFATAYRDTVVEWMWADPTAITLNVPNASDGRWGTMVVPLALPKWPLGASIATQDYGTTTEIPAVTGAYLFRPLSEAAGEGLLQHGAWAWGFQISANTAVTTFSNPRFVYLGEW